MLPAGCIFCVIVARTGNEKARNPSRSGNLGSWSCKQSRPAAGRVLRERARECKLVGEFHLFWWPFQNLAHKGEDCLLYGLLVEDIIFSFLPSEASYLPLRTVYRLSIKLNMKGIKQTRREAYVVIGLNSESNRRRIVFVRDPANVAAVRKFRRRLLQSWLDGF